VICVPALAIGRAARDFRRYTGSLSSSGNVSPILPEPSPVVASEAVAPARDPVWTGGDVVAIALVAMVAILVFSILGVGIARVLLGAGGVGEFGRDARVIVPVQAAAYAVVVAFMYRLVTRRYRQRFRDAVRWHWPGGRWIGLVGIGGALAFAVEFASRWLPIPRQLPIDEYFNSATAAYLMAAFGVLLAPVVEELFFRGFLYPVLARRWGAAAGVVVTALAFALIHESQLAHAWAPLALLFFVGLVLTLARVRWQSVAAPVLIHVGYNLTLFGMVWAATDGFRHLEKLK
jgi:membrane protease YdiL (CAAX protease family)